MKILGIIPSRYGSTRFPGKPLVDIKGKSMIWRVYEQSAKSGLIDKLIVATDDSRIYHEITSRGGEAVMTSTEHKNGTERCVEALEKSGTEYDYVINIQGDEPFMKPEHIDKLAILLDGTTEIATLVTNIKDERTLWNEGVAKVILNKDKEVLYFSRQVIPFLKGYATREWPGRFPFYKHVSLYGYRSDILKTISTLPPSPLETAESLEQLRWLENGYRIKADVTDYHGVSIDTPEDLEYMLQHITITD